MPLAFGDIARREQIGDGHIEGLGDLLSRRQRNIPLRAFNRPDKGPVIPPINNRTRK